MTLVAPLLRWNTSDGSGPALPSDCLVIGVRVSSAQASLAATSLTPLWHVAAPQQDSSSVTGVRCIAGQPAVLAQPSTGAPTVVMLTSDGVVFAIV